MQAKIASFHTKTITTKNLYKGGSCPPWNPPASLTTIHLGDPGSIQ